MKFNTIYILYIYVRQIKTSKTKEKLLNMDSRTSSILINLDLKNITSKTVAKEYISTVAGIKDAEKDKKKVYSSLRSTVKECYLTGSLKYGNNFIM